jgi:hypothetical protein
LLLFVARTTMYELHFGSASLSFDGQMDETGFHFRRTHFGGLAFVVEDDKLFHPVQVGLLGADGIMLDTDAGPVEVRIHRARSLQSRRMNPYFVSNRAFAMVSYETAVLLYRKDVPRISAGFPRADEITRHLSA